MFSQSTRRAQSQKSRQCLVQSRPTLSQFMQEDYLVNRLEQSRPQLMMYLNRCANDDCADLILFHEKFFLCVLRASARKS